MGKGFQMLTRSRTVACVSAVAAACFAPVWVGTMAQEQGAAGASAPPASTSEVVLAIEHSGLSSMLVDEKDAALKRALEMLPARLRELPSESPELAQIPMPAIELVISMLESPGRLALTYDEQNQAGGGFGLGLVLSVGPMDRQEADAMQGRVGALLAMGQMPAQPVPSEQFEGMSEMYLPFGTVRFGPRQEEGGAWRYELHVGALHDADAPFAHLAGAPEAGQRRAGGEPFTPVVRGELDFGPLAPLGEQLIAMFAAENPQAAQQLEMLKQRGLIGEDAISVSFDCGQTPTRSVSHAVVHGLRQYAAASGVSTEPLSAEALRMIPSDAIVGGVQRVDLSSLHEWVTMALEADPQAAQAMEQAEATTGVNPVDDLLATIGGTFGWYMADSTGGGGLGSLVGFAELKDRAKFAESNGKLLEFANAMLSQSEARGHVAMREWSSDGSSLYTLTFPGLPVPFELTYSITGPWLVAGLTPQAVVAASRQAAGSGDAGLADNAAASEALKRRPAVTSISFVDSARTIRDGYALTSMIGSAVANLVRSPIAAAAEPGGPDQAAGAREPGLIVPPYRDLVEGARPMVSISYWDGDDLVTESTADRSALVNGAGVIGAASPWFPVVGALIGAAGAAAEKQHQQEQSGPGWE